jgi:GAF domain-containing protein
MSADESAAAQRPSAAQRAGARLLAQLSRALARERRSDIVVQTAVDALVAQLGAHIAAVFLYDEDNNAIRPAYSVNYPAEVLEQIARVRIETPTLANLALITGEVQIASLQGDGAPEAPGYTRNLGERMGVHVAAAVPLLAGGRRLGVLIYGLDHPHAFDAVELELLREVGDRVSAALERARLDEALTRRAEEAELLQAILVAASGQDNLGRILASTLERLRGLLDFTGGSIALVESDELVVQVAEGPFATQAVGQRQPRGRGRTWAVIETGETFLARDLAAEGLRSLSAEGNQTLRSYLAVPLIWRGAPNGLL